jgi:hypothetical protein
MSTNKLRHAALLTLAASMAASGGLCSNPFCHLQREQSFTYVVGLPPCSVYSSDMAGYVVMTIEDKNQNLLAIGSIAGGIGGTDGCIK